MSIPISFCLVSKAALGDEEAFGRLKDVMKINIKQGHWSQGGCHHQPPCPQPTEEQVTALNMKLAEAIAAEEEAK